MSPDGCTVTGGTLGGRGLVVVVGGNIVVVVTFVGEGAFCLRVSSKKTGAFSAWTGVSKVTKATAPIRSNRIARAVMSAILRLRVMRVKTLIGLRPKTLPKILAVTAVDCEHICVCAGQTLFGGNARLLYAYRVHCKYTKGNYTMAKNLDDYMTDNWDDKSEEMINAFFDDNPHVGAEMIDEMLKSDAQLKNYALAVIKANNILDDLEDELEKDWNESQEPDPDREHDKDR